MKRYKLEVRYEITSEHYDPDQPVDQHRYGGYGSNGERLSVEHRIEVMDGATLTRVIGVIDDISQSITEKLGPGATVG